jgi:hypothetical protein
LNLNIIRKAAIFEPHVGDGSLLMVRSGQPRFVRRGGSSCSLTRPMLLTVQRFRHTDLPDGGFSEIASTPHFKNISLYQKQKSCVWFAPSRAQTEGRIAIVTKRGAGGDGRFGIN